MTKSLYDRAQEDIARSQKAALVKLLKLAGRQTTLADELKVDRQVVHNWVARGRISATGACLVERHPILSRQITKEELRPDVAEWRCGLYIREFRKAQKGSNTRGR